MRSASARNSILPQVVRKICLKRPVQKLESHKKSQRRTMLRTCKPTSCKLHFQLDSGPAASTLRKSDACGMARGVPALLRHGRCSRAYPQEGSSMPRLVR